MSTMGSAVVHGPTGGATGGSSFTSLPGTALGWAAVGVSLAYLLLATVMANTVMGLPAWLDFTLGIGVGAIAAGLQIAAMTKGREHSWMLWLTAAVVVVPFAGWLVFGLLASGLF